MAYGRQDRPAGEPKPAHRKRRAGFSFGLRSGGFTLAEILTVLVIIGLLSAALLPALRSTDPSRLDYAVREVVAALEFARNTAQSTGLPMGVRFYDAQDMLQLFSMSGARGSYIEVFDVYHPHDKNLYKSFMVAPDGGDTPDLKNAIFNFEGNNESAIAFNERGEPARPDKDMRHTLTTGSVELKLGSLSAKIHVNAVGRVWVE